MDSAKLLTVSFETTVCLIDRGDYWAARIDPFVCSLTVTPPTRPDNRAGEMMDFWLKNTPDIRPYLDSHQIPYTVDYIDDEDEETGSVKLTYSTPVKTLVGSAPR